MLALEVQGTSLADNLREDEDLKTFVGKHAIKEVAELQHSTIGVDW